MNLGHYEIPYEEWHRYQRVVDAARAWARDVLNAEPHEYVPDFMDRRLIDAVRALEGDQ